MEFDSHTSDVVEYTVAVINSVTPGQRHGRDFAAPEGDALVAAVHAAVPTNRAPDSAEATVLAGWASRLRAVVEMVDAGDVDAACVDLNDILRATNAMPTLSRHDNEPWHLHFHSTDADWATSWAAPMATGLAIVLGNAAIERLGLCNAPACDRVYIDVSRNGTRRFCSTACQNRVKAAAFRARRATT